MIHYPYVLDVLANAVIYHRVDSMNVQNRSLARCIPGLRQKTYVCLMHSFVCICLCLHSLCVSSESDSVGLCYMLRVQVIRSSTYWMELTPESKRLPTHSQSHLTYKLIYELPKPQTQSIALTPLFYCSPPLHAARVQADAWTWLSSSSAKGLIL